MNSRFLLIYPLATSLVSPAALLPQQPVTEDEKQTLRQLLSRVSNQRNAALEADLYLRLARLAANRDRSLAVQAVQAAMTSAGTIREAGAREDFRAAAVEVMAGIDLEQAVHAFLTLPARVALEAELDAKSRLADRIAARIRSSQGPRKAVEFLVEAVRAGACQSGEAAMALQTNARGDSAVAGDLASAFLQGCPEEHAVAREVDVLVRAAEAVAVVNHGLAVALIRKGIRLAAAEDFDEHSGETVESLFAAGGEKYVAPSVRSSAAISLIVIAMKIDVRLGKEAMDRFKANDLPDAERLSRLKFVSAAYGRKNRSVSAENEQDKRSKEIAAAEMSAREARPGDAYFAAASVQSGVARFYALAAVAARTDVPANSRVSAISAAAGLENEAPGTLGKLFAVERMLTAARDMRDQLKAADSIKMLGATITQLCGTPETDGSVSLGQCVLSTNAFAAKLPDLAPESLAERSTLPVPLQLRAELADLEKRSAATGR